MTRLALAGEAGDLHEGGAAGQMSEAVGGAAPREPGASGHAPMAGDSAVAGAAAGGHGGEGGNEPLANCELSAPFGEPSLLFDTNQTKRSGARFWPDERSLYFSTAGDIYHSIRAAALVAFPPGDPVKDVNTADLELSPVLTRDGLSLYLDGSGIGLLRVATRMDASSDFGMPTNLAGLEAYPAAP